MKGKTILFPKKRNDGFQCCRFNLCITLLSVIVVFGCSWLLFIGFNDELRLALYSKMIPILTPLLINVNNGTAGALEMASENLGLLKPILPNSSIALVEQSQQSGVAVGVEPMKQPSEIIESQSQSSAENATIPLTPKDSKPVEKTKKVIQEGVTSVPNQVINKEYADSALWDSIKMPEKSYFSAMGFPAPSDSVKWETAKADARSGKQVLLEQVHRIITSAKQILHGDIRFQHHKELADLKISEKIGFKEGFKNWNLTR